MTQKEARNLKEGDYVVKLDPLDIMEVLEIEKSVNGNILFKQVNQYKHFPPGRRHYFEFADLKAYKILTETEKARLI